RTTYTRIHSLHDALPILGESSGMSGNNSFYVVPFTPSISNEALANSPGSTINITGTGFALNETVNFSMGGKSLGSTVAGLNGSLDRKSTRLNSSHQIISY